MAHVSWFLLTPNAGADPYDNDLAIHLNLGKNGMMQARRRTGVRSIGLRVSR